MPRRDCDGDTRGERAHRQVVQGPTVLTLRGSSVRPPRRPSVASRAKNTVRRTAPSHASEKPGRTPCHTWLVAGDKKFDPKAVAKAGLNMALEAQYPLAVHNVARLRRVHPDKSPAELISYLNKIYIGTVTTTGAGAGAAAVIPNGWVQVPAAFGDLFTFMEASVLYTLSVAEIHGLDVEDVERRRFLVTSVLVGNAAATAALEPVIGRTAPFWGKKVVESIPMSTIKSANKVLGPRFVTKYGTKQGVLVLGKQVPLFIGAVIGGCGNGIFGAFVVKAAKTILGPPPEYWGAPQAPEPTPPSEPSTPMHGHANREHQ